MTKASKFLGHWGAVCGLLVAGLFLAGCRGSGGSDQRFSELPGVTAPVHQAPFTSTTTAKATPTASSNLAPASGGTDLTTTEVLYPGEPIIVTITDIPTPVQPYDDQIKADGTITLIESQTFMAAGKTRRQLEEEIHNRYVPSIYRKLTATVKPKDQTRFYYVDGDVKAPGRQLYIERLSVLKAISSCGGFTEFARRRKVKLTRTDGSSFTINCPKALKNPKLDLEVFPGDKIWVPRKWL